MINRILFSLGIAIGVSLIIAAILHFGFGLPFIACSLITFVLQFLGGYALNTYLEQVSANRAIRDAARIQADAIESAISLQSLTLNCAYCNTLNVVPIAISEENIFKCVSCNQNNAVMMTFMSARVTTPVARRVETELQINGLPEEIKEVVEEREATQNG